MAILIANDFLKIYLVQLIVSIRRWNILCNICAYTINYPEPEAWVLAEVTAITTVQETTTPYNEADVKVATGHDIKRGKLSGNKSIVSLNITLKCICFDKI